MATARRGLSGLFPVTGPWTVAVLGYPDLAVDLPTAPIAAEVDLIGGHRLAAKTLDLMRDRDISVEDSTLSRLRTAEFTAAIGTVQARNGVAEAVGALDDAGIASLIIKGPGIARSYRKAKWRPYADIDLLVAPSEFTAAYRILHSQGWSRSEPRPLHRPYFARFCVEGVNLGRGGRDPLDLHHAVTPWLWGRRLRFEDLWRRRTSLIVDGRSVAAVSDEDNFVVAVLHLVSDHSAPGRTLMIWQDLVELSRNLDSDRLIHRLDEIGLRRWAIEALRGLPAPIDAVQALRPSDADFAVPHRRRLALLLSDDVARRPALEWLARLPPAAGALFLIGLLLPSREFLLAEGLGAPPRAYPAWWRSLSAS